MRIVFAHAIAWILPLIVLLGLAVDCDSARLATYYRRIGAVPQRRASEPLQYWRALHLVLKQSDRGTGNPGHSL